MKENEFYLILEENITKVLFDRGKEIGEDAICVDKEGLALRRSNRTVGAQSVFIEYVDWEIIKALALPTTASPSCIIFFFLRKTDIENKSYFQLLSAVNLGHQNSLKS